jgi:acyl-CoA synthetase (AMP-forming)/AMP-acid ligase II
MNLVEFLYRSAELHAERPAVTDLGTGVAFTYAALAYEASALGAALRGQGVRPGQRIALVAPNGAAYLAAAFGLLEAGACIVPIALNASTAEVRRIFTEIDVHACLRSADAQSAASAARDVRQPTPPGAIETGACAGFTLHWIAPRAPNPAGFRAMDPAFVRFTSGTTARARGVVLSHAATAARVEASDRVLRFTAADRIVWVLPLAYHFAVTIVAYARAGAHMLMCPDALPRAIVDAIRHFDATVLYASPLHFERMGTLRPSGALSSLRIALSTSAPIRREVIERFEALYDVPVCQAYGIIEAGLPCINLRRDGTPPMAVGRPVPGYEIAIVDEAGAPVARGLHGEVMVRGSGLFCGYYRPWQPFGEIARDGWLATGDIGNLDASGALTLTGRKKALISMGGVKFFPEEVEACIDAFPGVRESRVYGRPHAHLGEVPCAEVASSIADLDLDALRAHCLHTLSPYKVPAEFAIVSAVARTPGGKLLRHAATDVAPGMARS